MENGSHDELVYLGGFFDGEGCIHVGKDCDARSAHGARHQLVVQVVQTSEYPLDRYMRRWGGTIFHRTRPQKEGHNLVWAWRLFKKEGCKRFCDDILPYVIIKKPQIELCLEFTKLLMENYGYNRWNPMPKSVWDERERLYHQCMELKNTVPGRT